MYGKIQYTLLGETYRASDLTSRRDAGVALSCRLPYLLNESGIFDGMLDNVRSRQGHANTLSVKEPFESHLHVIELGSGCSMVST